MMMQFQARFFTLRFVNAGVLMLIMIGVSVSLLVAPASAQSGEAAAAMAEPVEEAVTATELAEMLTASEAEERNRAFQLIAHFAYHRPDIDLRPTVPVLVDIYKNDPDKQDRLAAVAVIHAIGDETGLQEVRQRFLRDPSLVVQHVSLYALLDYYGPRAIVEDAKTAAQANNILARMQEAARLSQVQRTAPITAERH